MLKPSLRQSLEGQLFESACKGFRREASVEFRKDVASHLRGGTLYVVIFEGRAEGFAVMQDFREIGATYIAGIVKNGKAPSGVIDKIVRRHASLFETVVVRTQNDRVVEIMRGISEEVIPMHRNAEPGELEILKTMGLDKSSDGTGVGLNMIARRHYGGSPMIGDGSRPRSKDLSIRNLTDRLDYEKGDALLLIGYK